MPTKVEFVDTTISVPYGELPIGDLFTFSGTICMKTGDVRAGNAIAVCLNDGTTLALLASENIHPLYKGAKVVLKAA